MSNVVLLKVGTETLIDKSKSTKTVLMDLFPGNADVEGATVVNACYGGTAALLNALLWVESDGWDGRYAVVVVVNIATYTRSLARPTCGAGAVAVLVSRNAPLAMVNPRERAMHATNMYDFYKPDYNVEYPVMDGALSQMRYYRVLEDCYAKFCDRVERLDGVVVNPCRPVRRWRRQCGGGRRTAIQFIDFYPLNLSESDSNVVKFGTLCPSSPQEWSSLLALLSRATILCRCCSTHGVP